jgi:hypothetical protein
MPEDVQTYAARVAVAAGPDGRLRFDPDLVVWDDFLPPVPVEVRDANAAFVVERLVADVGGRAHRG